MSDKTQKTRVYYHTRMLNHTNGRKEEKMCSICNEKPITHGCFEKECYIKMCKECCNIHQKHYPHQCYELNKVL